MKNDNTKNTIKVIATMFGIITGIDYIYGMFYYKTFVSNNSIRKLSMIKFLSSIFLTSFLLVYPYKFINQFKFSEELLPYLYFVFNFIMLLSNYIYRKFLLNKFKINKIYKSNIVAGMLYNSSNIFRKSKIPNVFRFDSFYLLNVNYIFDK